MKYLKHFLLALSILMVGDTHAQTCATTDNVKTCTYNIPDDGHAIVPIPFGFPFYGQVFTHSIFFDNGAVSFYSPTQPQRWGPSWPGGLTIDQNTPSSFFYSIIPLGADLIANGGTHYTQENETFLKYTWNNVSQYGRWDSRNTFDLEIRPTGYIGINYHNIDIQGGWVSGIIGNASLGEFTTFNSTSSWNINETYGLDCSNPLNNSNCPGYAEAMFTQQCSISSLYSPACPGYGEAVFTQQCSYNTLYDPMCPGYAEAFLTYQCSLNSLYSTTCVGYEQAYFDQQCSLDPLYNSQCSGYEDAYYVQQCNSNPLYDSGCTGYDQAYFDQQCSLSALYNDQCPGYAQAFFDQQCSLNGLYDRTCPNYNDAYAISQLLNPKTADASESNTAAATSPIVISENVVASESAAQSQPPAASTSPADVSSPVQLIAAAPRENTSNDTSKSSTPSTSSTGSSSSSSQQEKRDAPKTTRQQLAERRMEAARKAAVEKATSSESGSSMSAEMDSAATMEKQAEIQNVLIGAMGFVPGFDVYGSTRIPDSQFYKPFEIYKGNTNVDNQRMLRGLSGRSDILHSQMVDQQYNK